MKAKELVGKLAIRKKPIKLGICDFTGEYNYDYSHTTSPLRILKVTDEHIIVDYKGTDEEVIFGNKVHILDERWNDDNWIDYEELIKVGVNDGNTDNRSIK